MLVPFCNILKKLYFDSITRKFNTTVTESHKPVMAKAAVKYLEPKPGQRFIDMTFGAGGHTKELLNNCNDIKILALDRDPYAYEYAKKLSIEYPDQIIPLLGKFSDIPKLAKHYNIEKNSIDGILFDFGCSSLQFDNGNRGFAISKNGPLDMRMDANRYQNQITAENVLAKIDERDLVQILRKYGEEKAANKIAKALVQARSNLFQIKTTKQLADLVEACTKEKYRLDKLKRPTHVATKTFQALRIFINNELNEINYSMLLSYYLLKKKGRLVTLTFHSLEDTIVKRHLNGNIIEGIANPIPLKYSRHDIVHTQEIAESLIETGWKQLHKHVITPDDDEISKNPRSRSAKLRAAVKTK